MQNSEMNVTVQKGNGGERDKNRNKNNFEVHES